MKTGLITYNVNDRDREHRGAPRNFDTAALAQVVNAPATQERVRKRDMHGYFGHWPRQVFGLEPGEGGMVDGKAVHLEAAIVTTTLRAMPDGTIEHESEFLDTAPGRMAMRMWNSRAGGWSSAISYREYGGKDVALGFHGFDYVAEPNFSKNRGYVLDSAGAALPRAEAAVLLDAAMREGQVTLKALDSLYSRLQGDYDRLAQAYQRSQAEVGELVDIVAKAGASKEGLARVLARLDSAEFNVRPSGRGMTVLTHLDSAPMVRTAREFDAMHDLPEFEPRVDENAGVMRRLRVAVDGMLSQFGYGR